MKDFTLYFKSFINCCDNAVIWLGNADYTATSRVITFPASETTLIVPIPIMDDDVVEPEEFFTAMISEVTDESDVEITRDMTQVFITNDDSKSSLKFSVPHCFLSIDTLKGCFFVREFDNLVSD